MSDSRKINIGIVVNDLVIGGVSSVVIHLSNALIKLNYNVHLLILSNNTQMESVIPLDNAVKKHIIEYEFDENYSLIAHLKNAFTINDEVKRSSTILKTIKSLDLSILHFHTLPRQLSIGIIAKKRFPKIKLVYTDHTYRLNKIEYNWYQYLLLKIAYQKLYRNYHLIAVSEAVSRYIKSCKLHHPKKKFKTLTNSIDIESYSRTTPIEKINNPTIIYISRLCKQKGLETLFKAWKIMKTDGELLLVGPDEANGLYHSMAKDIPGITFIGSTPDVKAYLDKSNIAVFPSEKEGLPLSLLEKMAYELPTITSDIPELTSIVTHNVNGLNFRKNDHIDLAEKMSCLIKDAALRLKLGKEARITVQHISEKNKSSSFHKDFYNELLP